MPDTTTDDRSLVIADRSLHVRLGDQTVRVQRNRTMAEQGHPIVTEYPHLWRPLEVHHRCGDELAEQYAAQVGADQAARPKTADKREVWDGYARSLGLIVEATAVLNKGELIALCDGLDAGTLRLADDGTVVHVDADGTLSPPITGDGTGTPLPPIDDDKG